MKIVDQSVRILSPVTKGEALRQLGLAEYAGRNCYASQNKITEESYETFLASLIKRGHGSPLEFAEMAVEIYTSRDVMAEITRHRHASFAIRSQRYVKEDKDGDIAFIRPAFWTSDPFLTQRYTATRAWESAMSSAESVYNYLLHDCAMAPQDARKVLPNSTATNICMKANLREWRHIIALRSAPGAYQEMRQMIELLILEMKKLFPPFLIEDVAYRDKGE